MTLNGGLPLNTTGITGLTLNGLGGDNAFTLTAGYPYLSVTVNGSGLSDPDVLTLNADGTPVQAYLGLATPNVIGGGFGAVPGGVFINGVGTVNLKAGPGNVTVYGTAAAENFNVTPAAGSAAVQANGSAPVLNAATSGTLTIDPLGGGDTVTINATGASDQITATGQAAPTNPTVQVGALLPVTLAAGDTAAR